MPPVSPANGTHPRPAINGNGFHKVESPVLDSDAKQARKELKEGLLRLGVEWEDNETVQSGTEHLVEVRKRDSNYRTVIKSFVSSYRKREQLQLPNISSCKQFRKHYGWIVGNLKKAGESVEEEMVSVRVPCGNGCTKVVKMPKSKCVLKE